METSESIDMKMWLDIENIMQDFTSDDISDLVHSECSQDQLFIPQNLTDFGSLKSDVFAYQSDASLYDEKRHQKHQPPLGVDPLKNQLNNECDPFVTPAWSELKFWDSDPPLVHVKEEQPSPLPSEFNSVAAPNATLKVLRESRLLGVPSDPYMWTPNDVQKWATLVLDKKSLTSQKELVKSLIFNGSVLCAMQPEDIKEWIQHDDIAKALFVELELWKCAQHLPASWQNSSTMPYNSMSQHSNNYVQVLSLETPPSINNLLENLAVPSIQAFSSFNGHPPADISSSNNINNSSSSGSSNSYSCNKMTSELNPSQAVRPNSLALQPTYFADSQQHLSSANDPVLPQFSFFMSPNSYNSSPASNSSILDFNYSNMTEVPSGSTNTSPSSSIPEFYEVFGSQNDLSEKTFNESPVQTARQGNQLWQFLKELLLQPCHYENCIRWLDRSKGIFKIEDSIKVAKLWGQRKNRPAMNYDKLSRSIRQYYKKGIIKKTSQSKRLVYQFCQKYA